MPPFVNLRRRSNNQPVEILRVDRFGHVMIKAGRLCATLVIFLAPAGTVMRLLCRIAAGDLLLGLKGEIGIVERQLREESMAVQ